MAGEIQLSYQTGKTVYSVIRNHVSGYIWSLSGGSAGAFEQFTSGNWQNYAISLTEQGVSSYYAGNFPSAAAPSVYALTGYNQAGASPLQTDAAIANGNLEWNGSAINPLSDYATSGQLGQIAPIRLARGVALSGFPFYLKSSADHVTPLTSGVVSGQISRDGGNFGVLQSGLFTETGQGWYRTNFTSGDLLATTVAVLFTANGISGGASDPLPMSFVMQRTSGQ